MIAVLAWVVGGLAFAALTIGALRRTTTGSAQATVEVTGALLTIRPTRAMRLWALSSGLVVPLASVSSTGVTDYTADGHRYWRPNGMRAPGAYMPGVVCAGTYRSKGTKELWFCARAHQAVDISMTGNRYARVVVQVTDPQATAEAIRAALP